MAHHAVNLADGADFCISFIVALAKSSETRRERMLVPHSVACRAASLPPAFSACLIWFTITAAVLCRMSARSLRNAAMSASAARMSITTLSGTARLPTSNLVLADDVTTRSAALPASPSAASCRCSPAAAAAERRKDSSRSTAVLASASSIRISTWQQFTSTSRIQSSSGNVADSSFCTIRCAPCLIISRTQARSCRPLLTRPSVS
mmetsp:Transcript_11853/g.32401  ORF Transcript_11853/g.32401 Transcript_11853/m.32401 type:complete len:206 (+) Transcript_11853:150-767(+)